MPQAEKTVRYIAPKTSVSEDVKNKYLQKRVAAYCRVSTQQEEQINSYEVQTRYYTEKINAEPKWKLVRIFADKGISGTSTKHRDEFNKMIRMCKCGRIDMIITKSISRFARNTVDCLKYIRLLKDINVDVYFEEQGIHSIEKGSEFYITVYGSIAQSESENTVRMSDGVRNSQPGKVTCPSIIKTSSVIEKAMTAILRLFRMRRR